MKYANNAILLMWFVYLISIGTRTISGSKASKTEYLLSRPPNPRAIYCISKLCKSNKELRIRSLNKIKRTVPTRMALVPLYGYTCRWPTYYLLDKLRPRMKNR